MDYVELNLLLGLHHRCRRSSQTYKGRTPRLRVRDRDWFSPWSDLHVGDVDGRRESHRHCKTISGGEARTILQGTLLDRSPVDTDRRIQRGSCDIGGYATDYVKLG